MTVSRLDRGLGALTAVMFVAAWLRWRAALPPVDIGAAQVPRVSPPTLAVPAESLDVFVETTSANDPFRISNTPADVRFDARADVATASGAPAVAAPRPQLVVRGIVGGPPWQAIVDGIPGQPPGTVVQPGASFDRLVVRMVSRDTVVMQGPDTTWKLTMNRPRP